MRDKSLNLSKLILDAILEDGVLLMLELHAEERRMELLLATRLWQGMKIVQIVHLNVLKVLTRQTIKIMS
jgi:hypothetical protein